MSEKKQANVNEGELIHAMSTYEGLRWFVAMGASEFVSAPVEELGRVDVGRLWEIRMFNEKQEIRALRGNLGEDFQLRDSLNYVGDKEVCPLLEEHYLDINKKKGFGDASNYVMVNRSMMGNGYGLPYKANKVEVENYYRADARGLYQPFDFRIVRFVKERRSEEWR